MADIIESKRIHWFSCINLLRKYLNVRSPILAWVETKVVVSEEIKRPAKNNSE
jgi:hypothetical protein